MEHLDSYWEGIAAYDNDERIQDCPYPDGTENADEWIAGFKAQGGN